MSPSFVTQTKLGEWFGLSSIKIGRILTENGLKDRSEPTTLAVESGYAKPTTTKNQLTFWVWDAGRVTMIINEALEDFETPYIDDLVAKVREALEEANRYRIEGSDFVADLIEEQTLKSVPLGLDVLIRTRVNDVRKAEARVVETLELN